MNDELERIWNEAVATLPRYYPSIWLEGKRKKSLNPSVRVAAVRAEVRDKQILNTSP
jgi:hypothetical protein